MRVVFILAIVGAVLLAIFGVFRAGAWVTRGVARGRAGWALAIGAGILLGLLLRARHWR